MPRFNRRSVILSLSALTLAACGSRVSAPAVQTAIAVRPPRFTDSKPVDWNGRAPADFRVHGIDAARFQKEINWRQARAAGVNFAFVKATEGGDLLDPQFRNFWEGAARADVLRGAYHFYYFCTDAATQARWFIRNVPRERGALPPVLDLEWNPFSPTCRKRPAGEIVRREVRIFLDMVEAHFGQRPIIYTTPGFYRDTDLGQMGREEFWLRATARTPAEVYPGQSWRFWQYSGTGIVPGIGNHTDLNLFNGSAADWAAWLARRQL